MPAFDMGHMNINQIQGPPHRLVNHFGQCFWATVKGWNRWHYYGAIARGLIHQGNMACMQRRFAQQ